MKIDRSLILTVEQAAFLHMCGCDQLQGYFFGKPVSEKAIDALLVPQEDMQAAG